MLLDIHSHHPAPYPQGVVSIVPEADFSPSHGQKYSIGLHPWQTEENASETIIERILSMSVLPDVVAIGECGLDATRDIPMSRQLEIFEKHIFLSEKLKKPLIIHCVKAFDSLIATHRKTRPSQLWIIHGFRGKPRQAEQLRREGLLLSFGAKYNPETLKIFRPGEILFESDDETLPIDTIYRRAARLWKIPRYLVVARTAESAHDILHTADEEG